MRSPGTPASDRRGYAQSSLVNGALAVCREFVLLQESPVGKIINDFGRRFDIRPVHSSVPTPEGDASSDWCTSMSSEDQRARCDLLPAPSQGSRLLAPVIYALERSWQTVESAISPGKNIVRCRSESSSVKYGKVDSMCVRARGLISTTCPRKLQHGMRDTSIVVSSFTTTSMTK